MSNGQQAVVLVGHGGVPKDCPPELVRKLKQLESQRRAAGAGPSSEEVELAARIRRWPRTPANDPYRSGLELLASHLRPRLNGALFAIAYNEFCAPTLEEAVGEVIAAGARRVTVVSTMVTPGGSHSEVEIPETIQHLRSRYPSVAIRYAWPFDLDLVAGMLSEHLTRFS